jgi:hypothetical protein
MNQEFSAVIVPSWLSIPIIIWGMNNRPVGGCSSETQSHPIDMNNNIAYYSTRQKFPYRSYTDLLKVTEQAWHLIISLSATSNYMSQLVLLGQSYGTPVSITCL